MIIEPDVLWVLLQSLFALMSFSRKVVSVDLSGEQLFLMKTGSLSDCQSATDKVKTVSRSNKLDIYMRSTLVIVQKPKLLKNTFQASNYFCSILLYFLFNMRKTF